MCCLEDITKNIKQSLDATKVRGAHGACSSSFVPSYNLSQMYMNINTIGETAPAANLRGKAK